MAITAAPRRTADFLLRRESNLMVFVCNTDAAKAQVEELGLEPWQMLGTASFAVDIRLAEPLAEQLSDEGFSFADE